MRYRTLSVVIIILIVAVVGLAFWNISESRFFNVKISTLQKEISGLQTTTSSISSSTQNVASAVSSQEFTNRQQVTQKSQEDLLTAAVAKTVPTVVSIVISELAPQYEVTYQNPFGDDPAYQGLNVRIPVYRQIGTKLQKVGAGTGILVSRNGYILTNKHVVSNNQAQYTVLLSNGKQEPAQVMYIDPKTDLAIVKINGTYNTIATLGNSDTLKLGQTVAAIGNALGEYNNSVSVGIISGLHRKITAEDAQGNTETLTDVIQTDSAINPGNSGGPLVDLSGNVVGVNVATVSGSNNISFAIPINTAKQIIAKYQ